MPSVKGLAVPERVMRQNLVERLTLGKMPSWLSKEYNDTRAFLVRTSSKNWLVVLSVAIPAWRTQPTRPDGLRMRRFNSAKIAKVLMSPTPQRGYAPEPLTKALAPSEH